jgi:DNA-binding CsgD family transcriptional regulator/PAS domain-containing protein
LLKEETSARAAQGLEAGKLSNGSIDMAADTLERVISDIYAAAIEPCLWASVLRSVTEATGAIGAAYIVRDVRAGRVDSAIFSGPSAQFTSDYMTRFAAKDPFIDLLAGHNGTWVRLSEHIAAEELRQNEWYTDFVLKSGVRDIVAAQVSDTGSHTAVFGVHEGIGEKQLTAANLRRLDQLLAPLRRAAELQLWLRELGWKFAVLARAFDQVATGFIVVDADGLVIEMNGLAERVVRRGDGLTFRNGALGAARVFQNARLGAAIMSATRPGSGATSSRILIGRQGGKHDYILAVSPLGADLGFYSNPMALIIVVDQEARSPKPGDLSAYFGLSFAEARLVTHLMAGKHLSAIAAETGASVATLRSQLRSVLKKINVERQSDLFLVLSRVPSLPDREFDGPADQTAFGR